MSAPTPPERPPNMGQDAGRSFLSGFAGCLGVGAALIFVIVVIAIIASAAGHH